MSVNLYDHQKKAVEKLKTGSILCGRVGSGKSRTALAYFYTKVCGGRLPSKSSYSSIGKRVPLYIITTARKRDTLEWDSECVPFLLKDYTIDSWNNIKKYEKVRDSFFIFDEQRVVGSGSWAKSFLKIASNNDWILLSATPGDVWMDYVPVFIANGFYKNKTEFVKRHVVYNRFTKYPKVERYLDQGALYKLRDRILVDMPYEKKSTRHHEWIKVGFDEDLYSDVKDRYWNVFEDRPVTNASEYCSVLRKIVNSDRRRTEAIKNILDRNRRCVVFYNFDYELYILREFLEESGVEYSEWNGHKHEPIPEGERWAYLVQYTAGAEGWNCVSSNTIIFYSQNYSYKIMEQASGRIDRINSRYTDLYYYHFFSDSEIDRAIRNCVKKKKKFNENHFYEKEGSRENHGL